MPFMLHEARQQVLGTPWGASSKAMGLYGQGLVQDKNLNPPDDRKYVILICLREQKGIAIPARNVKRSTPFVLDNAVPR
jgi:hypothetical protein